MKKISSLVATATTLISLNAFAQQPAQQPSQKLPENLVKNIDAAKSCLKAKIPANWSIASTVLDFTDPNKTLINNMVLLNGSKQYVPLEVCDMKTMAQHVTALTPYLPDYEKGWKQIYFSVDVKNNVAIFTDIDVAMRRKQK